MFDTQVHRNIAMRIATGKYQQQDLSILPPQGLTAVTCTGQKNLAFGCCSGRLCVLPICNNCHVCSRLTVLLDQMLKMTHESERCMHNVKHCAGAGLRIACRSLIAQTLSHQVACAFDYSASSACWSTPSQQAKRNAQRIAVDEP